MSIGTWVQLGIAALVVAAIFQTMFVAVYATRPWYTHYVGKALFCKSLALMVTLWVVVFYNLDKHAPWGIQFRVITLWFVALTIVGQCVALLLQVRLDREERIRRLQRLHPTSQHRDDEKDERG